MAGEFADLGQLLSGVPRIHLAITTHTTRHLRRTLLGAANQTRRPDSIVVSCDNDLAEIADLVRACTDEFGDGLPRGVTIVQRPSIGQCALAQVRNNAVRWILQAGAGEGDAVIFHDGDCCPAADCTAVHEKLLDGAELVNAYRVDLTEAQTETFDEAAVKEGKPPALITAEQKELLATRDKRYRRALALKRLGVPGLVKSHKPKILGANFSFRLSAYLTINGFDEEYLGYGSEDDDFSRRIYAAGFRPAVGVATAIVYHQWHQTRKPADWHDSPGVKRFEMKLPTRAARGLIEPIQQQTPRATTFVRGREVATALLGGPALWATAPVLAGA